MTVDLSMARHYLTFGFRAPVTRYRVVTCEEASCENWRRGFRIPCDLGTPLGRERAVYLRSGEHRRKFKERPVEGTQRVEFVFQPGTSCFSEHRMPIERHVSHVVRRGMPGRAGRPELITPTEWHDRLGENQERLRELQQRG